MNRRRFLQLVGAGMTGAAIAPSTLLPPDVIQPEDLIGVAIRFQREWNAHESFRIDVLFGFAAIRPDLACRIVDDGDIIEGDFVLNVEDLTDEPTRLSLAAR
jgi:hypothetical protein